MLLSILIPVYNERTVVEQSLALVLASPLPENMERELVIVDDCSTDGTWDILQRLAAAEPRIRLHRHAVNQGKGAAVRTAIGTRFGRFLPGAGRRHGVRSVGVYQSCCSLCWTGTPTRCSGRGIWRASRPACCHSGTP